MWHCPHCGAPQAETARCWVCRRSSTTCSTCRNFRVSLAADLGYCALDPRRRPLTGLELRACWESRPSTAGQPPGRPGRFQTDRLPARGFVPIDEVVPVIGREAPMPAAPMPAASLPEALLAEALLAEAREAPTSLFGDAER